MWRLWSPETHLLRVRSTWESSARNTSDSFYDRPLIFWTPNVRTISCTPIFLLLNFGLRHFWNDVMQLYYPQASISTNFPFNFLKKVVRDQRWPTASLFVVYISPSFGKFTATLRHILQIYKFTINSKNFFVNLSWTLTFCVEKSYDGTHLEFGGTLDRRCQCKHVSLKQNRFYHC